MISKDMQGALDGIAPPIRIFCQMYLDERYLERCLAALEKLCRKRLLPLLGGNPATWAAGIVNFVRAQKDRFVCGCGERPDAAMTAGFFVLSISSASAKAAQIRKLFHAKSCNRRCRDFFPDSHPPEDTLLR